MRDVGGPGPDHFNLSLPKSELSFLKPVAPSGGRAAFPDDSEALIQLSTTHDHRVSEMEPFDKLCESVKFVMSMCLTRNNLKIQGKFLELTTDTKTPVLLYDFDLLFASAFSE